MSGHSNLLPRPMVTPLCFKDTLSLISKVEVANRDTERLSATVNELGFLPPSQGSVNEKL